MWPLGIFKARASRKRRRAALLVLLGVVAYRRLSLAQQEAVESEIKRILEPFGVAYAWHEAACTAGGKAAYRAVAMARLGLSSGIESVPWESLLSPAWRKNPSFLYLSFHQFASETEAARQELCRSGFAVSENFPSQAEEDRAIFAKAHQ